MSSAKWRPFCPEKDELIDLFVGCLSSQRRYRGWHANHCRNDFLCFGFTRHTHIHWHACTHAHGYDIMHLLRHEPTRKTNTRMHTHAHNTYGRIPAAKIPPVPCATMNHFVTEMFTCVHISVTSSNRPISYTFSTQCVMHTNISEHTVAFIFLSIFLYSRSIFHMLLLKLETPA